MIDFIRDETEKQLKAKYQQFVDQFDPSPDYAFDDYKSLPDFDTWCHDYLTGEDYANIWK